MRNITEIMMGVDTMKSFSSALEKVTEENEMYFMCLSTHGVRQCPDGRYASFFDGIFDTKEEAAYHNYEVIFDLVMSKDIASLRSYIEECVIQHAPQMACGLAGYYIPLQLGGEYASGSKEPLTSTLLGRVLDKFDEMFSNISSIFAQPSLSARLMKMDLK